MFRNLTEKLGAKLPATTRGCSMVKFARLGEFLNWKQAHWKVNHYSKKIRKGEKGKAKNKLKKPKA